MNVISVEELILIDNDRLKQIELKVKIIDIKIYEIKLLKNQDYIMLNIRICYEFVKILNNWNKVMRYFFFILLLISF